MSVTAVSRLRWLDLPETVRAAAESSLGAAVASDRPQAGGFSPGLASRLVLADGRGVFAKAISGDQNPLSPGLYRREITIAGALPASMPTPRLQWSYDDGDWVMLVLDDVDGVMPATPWQPEQLSRVMTALEQLAAGLTPSPVKVVPIEEDLAGNFRSWHVIADDPVLARRLGAWERDNLADLADLESRWTQAARGTTLIHADLRADNLLLTSDGTVMVVDWPYAVAGAAWVDALLFLISAAADGGVSPGRAWATYAPARGVDQHAVDAVLAAAAGDFTLQSLRPVPPNMPLLREHQRRKGEAATGWLRSRLTRL